MRRFFVGTCGAVTGLVAMGMAQADEAKTLPSGPRVRLTAPSVSGKRLVGTVVGLDEVALTLQRHGVTDTMLVPRAAITRLEISRGRRRSKGALIGAVVGLGSGVALGLATGSDCSSDPDLRALFVAFFGGCKGTTRAVVISVATVPVGALVGFLVAPGEKWEASSPDRLRIAVAPTRGGGVRAAVSVRF